MTGLGTLISATEAAILTGRAPSTIRSWVRRGHLKPAHHRHGLVLYRAGDVLTAERQTRHRDTRKHGAA